MLKKIGTISDQHLSLLIASIILIGILALFLPIMLFSINQVTSQGETRNTEQEVIRAEKIFSNELNRLDKSLLDWSPWDETYQFAQDGNQDYIDNNLADTTLANLDIDSFLVLNAANEVVFGKYIDRNSGVEAPFPFDIQSVLKAYPSLLNHSDLQAGHQGIALIPNYPMLVTSRPILTSAKEGPAMGMLLFIRLLDAKELAEFSDLADRELAVFPGNSLPEGTPDLPAPALLKDQIFVRLQSSQIIAGYKYLNDLNGQPGLVLKVNNPRDLYAQGRTTEYIFSGIILVLGILVFSGTYHFTRMLQKSRDASRMYLKRFETIVHQSREAIILVGRDCKILEANKASRKLLCWEADEDPTPCLRSLLKFEPDLDERYILALCQSGEISEHRCLRRDGVCMDVELSASLITNPAIEAFSLMLRDVTAQKVAEKALQDSQERYMLAAIGANDGLWDWNLMNDQVYFSPRWKAMLGYAEREIGAAPGEWLNRIHPDDLLFFQTQLSDHLRNQTPQYECEYRMQRKDGNYCWMLARGVAVWDSSGFAIRIAGSLTDVHDRKTLEEQLRYDALHDALTGLGNRTLLIDHLRLVNERKKRKRDIQFALFFMDLDRFKQINDTLGHQAGDQLLIEASKRLDKGLRTTDTVTRFTGSETIARIAGDEFVLLLEDFQNLDDIQKVAERITSLVNAPYYINSQEVALTASFGLVVPEEAYDNPEDIIRDADIAMYRAKQLGGAQVVRFNQEMYQGTILRMQLESDLRRAVNHNEFEVFYQPIFSLDNDHISGFEALVRWNHPERGLLLPDEFIKTAEETGLIVPIGLFVLEEACRQMQLWRNNFKIPSELIVSVNFSARQLMAADLLDCVGVILDKTGFDPKNLWLEVTESTFLENNEFVLSQLNALRNLGIRIEIDDFGTGYSSLSYLQNLPVDGFKIDRSFIKDVQGGGQKIVKALIELGLNLGLIEVAEGVETEAQKDYLKTASCHYAQGFLLSRPINANAIEDLLGTVKPISGSG